jgi:hypothetical protein
MNTRLNSSNRPSAGYALLMVLSIVAASMLVAGATIYRTYTVAKLNDRNNQYISTMNAAEAAIEKSFLRMAYDFSSLGAGAVTNNLELYRTNLPSAAENSFWANFQFSNGQPGGINRIHVGYYTNYSGALPSQYPGLFTENCPVYRIVANAKLLNARVSMTNAVQIDVMFAEVPISQYAIFYQAALEFSTCAPMIINGRVHCNTNIYTGTDSSCVFNGEVTTTGNISSPGLNGHSSTWTGPTTYNATPYGYKVGVTSVSLSINMTNTHSLIDVPPVGESATSQQGQQRLYNQAQVVLLITNSLGVGSNNNIGVLRIQRSVSGQVPGADPSPITLLLTNNVAALSNNFPFIKALTNLTFFDQRENKTVRPTQIDLGRYSQWLTVNSNILNKFPTGSGTYPTILYVADQRATTASQMAAIRITNGIAPPSNGGYGFSLATPNPLYVWGHYNQTNAALLNQTNTTSGTVPCALMSDALTILSSNWMDSHCTSALNNYATNDASSTTVNAALLTGVVPTTGTGSSQFSGGVHNLPRLLEDWYQGGGGSQKFLTLNTSIANLFNSTIATGVFRNPSTMPGTSNWYYDPPRRNFSYDINFLDPAKQPPGMPCALVAIRYNWAVPPPNTITYNVIP